MAAKPKTAEVKSTTVKADSGAGKPAPAPEKPATEQAKPVDVPENVVADSEPSVSESDKKKKKRKKKKGGEQGTDVSEPNPSVEAKTEVIPEPAKAAPVKPAADLAQHSPTSLNDGLKTTRSQGFLAQIGKIFKGKMDSSVEEELEDVLFMADIGVQTAERLLARVTDNLHDKGDGAAAMALLKDEVRSILTTCEAPFEIGNEHPHVILTIGVNGAGKTTTLGKLAAKLTSEGKKVLLIAGDTFRAAAIEQLEEWAQRCGCEIFCNKKENADPSGTIFDGIRYAKEHGFDVALADTAGRLHNKKELIEELKKIHRVCGKAHEGAPHQVLLVLDATNGQNALVQAKEFGEAIPFSGIILTKLDGTAKGGVIIGICEEFHKPIYYIGIGEMIEDLRRFEAEEFVDALFLED